MSDYIRLTDMLGSYWDGFNKINGIPLESDIDADVLESIWDDCYLVHIKPDTKYQYDYLGKNLIAAYGEKSSHDEIELLVYPPVEKVSNNYDKILDSREMLEDSGEFINNSNMLIKFRQLLLPFGNNDGKITHILGGMRWSAC